MNFENYSFNNYSFNVWLISLTAVATWTGGAFIMGSLGAFYAWGMQWGLQWYGFYASTYIMGYLFFNKIVKEREYLSLVDMYQKCIGKYSATATITSLIMAFSEVLWISSIVLGCSNLFTVLTGAERYVLTIILTAISSIYTLLGGFKMVVFTDIIQMIIIVTTLYSVMIYLLSNYDLNIGKAYNNIDYGDSKGLQNYIEWWFISITGPATWNSYYHRIIASKNDKDAKTAGLISLVCITFVFLPIFFIGIISQGLTFNTAFDNSDLVYPYILKEIVPIGLGWFGSIGVCMAVLSSFDSSILSTALFLTTHISSVSKEELSDKNKIKISKILIVVLSLITFLLALFGSSVQDLVYLTLDIPSIALFPIFLTCICFQDLVEPWTSFIGIFLSLLIRVLSGLTVFNIDSVIPWPDYGPYGEFPFRTICVAINFFFITLGIIYNKYYKKRTGESNSEIEMTDIQTASEIEVTA